MKKLMLMGFMAAAVILINRPIAVWADAKDTKITGEVVDTFCYLSMGAKGAGHRSCGLECAKKGIPVGILENGTGKLYVLLPTKNDTSLPDNVINKMGQTTTVTGHVYSEGGSQFLTVESVS